MLSEINGQPLMHLASRLVVVLVIASAVALLGNCSHVISFALNLPSYAGGFERHADLAYGPGTRQRLDVYSTRAHCNRPVIVFWYGGLWIEGAKSDYRFVGAALARAGYVAVLPDYRLFPEVKFPAFIEDGARAVRWAHEHVGEYGGDPNAIFLMGHSAGAHIAASIAFDARYLSAAGVDAEFIHGFIGLSGPYALDADSPSTSRGLCAANVHCTRLLARIFTEPYSPHDWQPMPRTADLRAPALLLHGLNDTLVPVQHAELLRDRLRVAGVATESYFYEDVSHDDTVLGFALPRLSNAPVLRDVRRFIDRNSQAKVTDSARLDVVQDASQAVANCSTVGT